MCAVLHIKAVSMCSCRVGQAVAADQKGSPAKLDSRKPLRLLCCWLGSCLCDLQTTGRLDLDEAAEPTAAAPIGCRCCTAAASLPDRSSMLRAAASYIRE
jgi:hypothetical protein